MQLVEYLKTIKPEAENLKVDNMSKITVGLVEPITLIGKEKITVLGKFDTGAYRTSIDKDLFEKLGLEKTGEVEVRNVHGKTTRPLVEIEMLIKGRKFKIKANVADRSSRKFKVLIGRNTIFDNFIVDVTKSHNSIKIGDTNESMCDRS